MGDDPSWERLQDLINDGNACFRLGNYIDAEKIYSQGLEMCEKKHEWDAQRIRILSNRAQAWIMIGKANRALEDCDMVLQTDPKAWKVYLRKVKAHQELLQLNDAMETILLLISNGQAQNAPSSILLNAHEKRRELAGLLKSYKAPVLNDTERSALFNEDHTIRLSFKWYSLPRKVSPGAFCW
eukprot:CAMPEP_0203755068 /NCGR_PEP_ID=MMETSP0098-20131031/8585_1 /ASSEMBLY_ACC=CAM_ASM_000208 /TAXON_ID=96639 /ORGANISM=" , Strain NY0313808BC1" /LENGTH=182 /DNA_ID=CAMNT_0050646379 /DNA_START=92 /DNA_END=637 /DNA_ORIENTATION=-